MNLLLVLALISGDPGDPWNPPPGYDFWIGRINTSWNDDNWSGPFVPDGAGVKLLFGHDSDPACYTTVDLQQTPHTVGDLIFVQDRPITIQGAELTLDNGVGSSTLDISGTHTIESPVVIDNDVLIAGSGMLNLTGGISGNHTLTVTGNMNAESIQVDTLIIGVLGMQNAVPEPAAIALLFTGSLGVLAWRRWNR